MNSKKVGLLAIPIATILGFGLLFSGALNEDGETIQLNVADGIGLFFLDALNLQEKSSGITVKGAYDLVVKNEYGIIVDHKHADNLTVDIGIQTMADQIFEDIDLNGTTQNKFSWLGIGTGSTAPAGGNTDVETAIGGCSRVDDTLVEASFAANVATITVDASFSGANCAATVEEAVLANAASGGQIISRVLTGGTVVGAGDTLELTYTFTIADDGV